MKNIDILRPADGGNLLAGGSRSSIEQDEADSWQLVQRRRNLRRRVMPVVGIAVLLAIWWAIVAVFEVKPFIAPSPLAVFETLVDKRGILASNLMTTAIEAVGGFVLGNIVAILLATLFVYSRTVEEVFFPIALMLNAIPVVAKAPVLVLILGNGMEPKVAIAALVCFFPTLINTARGLNAVNPQALELMRVLSASKAEIFLKLRLQSALPFLFSAFRISASTAVIGAIVGEWVGANSGIGALIIQATYNFDSALLYSAIVMSALLSGAFHLLIAMIETRALRWSPEQAKER